MNRPDSRDDGTQSGPGEQIRPREKAPVSDGPAGEQDRAGPGQPIAPEGDKK
jgi:hypothetical protein